MNWEEYIQNTMETLFYALTDDEMFDDFAVGVKLLEPMYDTDYPRAE